MLNINCNPEETTINISVTFQVPSGKGPTRRRRLPEDNVTEGYKYIPQLDHVYHALVTRRSLKTIEKLYPEYLDALRGPLQKVAQLHDEAPSVITCPETELSYLRGPLREAGEAIFDAIDTLPTEADKSRCYNSEPIGAVIELGGEEAEACSVLDERCTITRQWAEDNNRLPPRHNTFDI